MFQALALNKDIYKFFSETCELGKHHRASFAPSINESSVPFSLLHFDEWGPSRITSLKGHRWFVTFFDYYSRTTWIYMMKQSMKFSLSSKFFTK